MDSSYYKKINGVLIPFVKYKTINRQKLKKARQKYYSKITNKVKDMHFKVAHELVNTYDNIYIGKLSTRKILSRNNKKLSKLNKRMIGVLAASLFRQRLAYMGYKYGSIVTEVSEYLTTKTCSNCGNKNEIGRSKKHVCKCGMKADRDENSAKNHLKIGLNTDYVKKKPIKKPIKKIKQKKIIEV